MNSRRKRLRPSALTGGCRGVMDRKAVTINDIARLAGATTATVSRALSGKPGVSAQRAGRIREIAARIGYHPHTGARELVQQRSTRIGCCIAGETRPYESLRLAPVLGGMGQALAENGLSLIVLSDESHVPPSQPHTNLPPMAYDRSLGALVLGGVLSNEILAQVLHLHIPVVFYNAQYGNEYDAVVLDDRRIMFQAVEHLTGLGHRRIAYAGTPQTEHPAKALRLEGYFRAMNRLEMTAITAVDPNGPVETQIEELLARRPRPTAVVCFNDRLAVKVMYLLEDRGIRVPTEMSVIGVDGNPGIFWTRPCLSSVRIPAREMGRALAEMVRAKMRDGQPVPSRRFTGEIVQGGSTGPPPSDPQRAVLTVSSEECVPD